MRTCNYCLDKLEAKENDMYYCKNCTMFFPRNRTGINGNRQHQTIEEIPSDYSVLEQQTTKEFLKLPTLELYYLLSMARSKDFMTREESQITNSIWKIKRLQLENILLERLGYYPRTISKSFLSEEITKISNCMNYKQF